MRENIGERKPTGRSDTCGPSTVDASVDGPFEMFDFSNVIAEPKLEPVWGFQ